MEIGPLRWRQTGDARTVWCSRRGSRFSFFVIFYVFFFFSCFCLFQFVFFFILPFHFYLLFFWASVPFLFLFLKTFFTFGQVRGNAEDGPSRHRPINQSFGVGEASLAALKVANIKCRVRIPRGLQHQYQAARATTERKVPREAMDHADPTHSCTPEGKYLEHTNPSIQWNPMGKAPTEMTCVVFPLSWFPKCQRWVTSK